MADQDHPPKSKRPKEDEDTSEAHTSMDDDRARGPDFPRENIQINADQQKKNDRNVGGSGQAECESEQKNPTYNHISHECGNGESELEKKKGNNAENSKVAISRESQEINDKNCGTVQGENDQMESEQIQRNRSQEKSKHRKYDPDESGYGDQRNSVKDHDVREIRQGKDICTVTEENTQISYSQVAHTPGNTQRSYSQAARTPGNTQSSYSQAVRTPGHTQRSYSQAARTPGNSQRSYSQAAQTPANTQRSYSQAARTPGNTQRSYSQTAYTPGNTQRSYSQTAHTPGSIQRSNSEVTRTPGNSQRSNSEQKPHNTPPPPPMSTKVKNT
jgi:hypothetical protein